MNLFFSYHCYLDGSWIFAHDRVGQTFANPDLAPVRMRYISPNSERFCRALRACLSLRKQLSSTRKSKKKRMGSFNLSCNSGGSSSPSIPITFLSKTYLLPARVLDCGTSSSSNWARVFLCATIPLLILPISPFIQRANTGLWRIRQSSCQCISSHTMICWQLPGRIAPN